VSLRWPVSVGFISTPLRAQVRRFFRVCRGKDVTAFGVLYNCELDLRAHKMSRRSLKPARQNFRYLDDCSFLQCQVSLILHRDQTGASRHVVLMVGTGDIGIRRFSPSGRWSANPGSWKRSKIDPISCQSILTTLFPQASATDLLRTVLNAVYFPGSIVAGHMSINRADSEWQLLLDAIREVHEDVPVFIFGGHNHVRNCERLDRNSIS
jgi:hypothetical protein